MARRCLSAGSILTTLLLLGSLIPPDSCHAREAKPRESTQEADAPDTVEEPERPVEKSLAFSPEERWRLGELRNWLRQRRLWRKQGGDLSVTLPGLRGHDFPAETPAQKTGKPILHISRGPDGRIHHRLIFREGRPDELQTDEPLFDPPNSLEAVTKPKRQPWLRLSEPTSKTRELRERLEKR